MKPSCYPKCGIVCGGCECQFFMSGAQLFMFHALSKWGYKVALPNILGKTVHTLYQSTKDNIAVMNILTQNEVHPLSAYCHLILKL